MHLTAGDSCFFKNVEELPWLFQGKGETQLWCLQGYEESHRVSSLEEVWTFIHSSQGSVNGLPSVTLWLAFLARKQQSTGHCLSSRKIVEGWAQTMLVSCRLPICPKSLFSKALLWQPLSLQKCVHKKSSNFLFSLVKVCVLWCGGPGTVIGINTTVRPPRPCAVCFLQWHNSGLAGVASWSPCLHLAPPL